MTAPTRARKEDDRRDTPTVSVRDISVSSGEARRAVDRASRRLNRYLAAALFGLVLIMTGLATDMLLHATDPDLAAEEGLFTLRNPGHILLGIGIALTAAGLSGAASALLASRDRPPRALRAGALALRVGILGLVIALIYIGTGPGFGHDHGGDVAAATELSDGTRLSSGLAAEVDRSRLPPAEAAALAALAWSREGFVDLKAHDHGDQASAPELSPAEQVQLNEQLAIAHSTALEYPTPAEAEADGYVQASATVNGVGAHWVKWSIVDRPFDPATPSMLLFEEIKHGEGPALVGLSYWVYSQDEPEGFAGGDDEWHGHTGLCFENGWLTIEDLPERDQCPGDWVNGSDLWMLHVWVLPEMQSRYGVFSAVNPKLCERSC